jgi:transposase InsO family protein
VTSVRTTRPLATQARQGGIDHGESKGLTRAPTAPTCAPNRAWYLATVLDLGSHRIVGFALANRMPDDLFIEAALATRSSLAGAIGHTDRAI